MTEPVKKKAVEVREHHATAKRTLESGMKDSGQSIRSTATADQRFRILEALRSGPKTSYDLRRIGAYQCPTRILDLRRAGYDIQTTGVTLIDRDGYSHRGVALYEQQSQHGGKAVQ